MRNMPLIWPDSAPRFVIRRADDRRYFVYDLLHERRCTNLMVELEDAHRALRACETARRRT